MAAFFAVIPKKRGTWEGITFKSKTTVFIALYK